MTDKSKQDYWQMQPKMDTGGLIAALSSDDRLIRRRAAVALQGMTVIDAIPALQKAHREEKDPETGMVIATAIQTLKKSPGAKIGYVAPDDDAPQVPLVERLILQVKSDNPEKIIEAATKLGEMGEKIAVEALILAFSNPKHTIHVRLAIAEALLKLESAPVEVALLANLRHSDWHIRRNGAAILGQLKATWAIEPLSQSLKDPHPVVRRTALAALKHIGTPESRRVLAQLASGNTQTRTDTREAPKKVSGIEVKRPGKQPDDADESSLLKRLRKEREAKKQRLVTKPLDPTTLEATQPIGNKLLDNLDALLDEDDDSA